MKKRIPAKGVKTRSKKSKAKTNVTKKTAKKTPSKKRKASKALHRKEKANRKAGLSKKIQLRKSKSAKKNTDKNKISISSQRTGSSRKVSGKSIKSSKGTNAKVFGKLEVTKQTRGTGKQLEYSFKKVKNIDKKITLFSEQSKESIKKQLKKFGGKPPRGFQVIVSASKGKGKYKKPVIVSSVTPYDFVVNEISTVKYVTGFLTELKDAAELYKIASEESDINEDEGELGETGSFENIDPDNINEILIKFIY